MDAVGGTALIDAIKAVVGANAGRISSSRPSAILRTMCGSAMWARVMPIMSTLPEAMA